MTTGWPFCRRQAIALGAIAVASTLLAPPPSLAESRLSYTPGGGLRWTSASGQSQWRLRGRIQADHYRFSGAYNTDSDGETATETFVRRARVSLEGRRGPWSVRAVSDHIQKQPRLVLAHLTYTGNRHGERAGPTVSLGLMKEDVSLEAMIGSRHSTAISRPMLANAFSPYYSYGLRVAQAFPASGTNFAVGVYKAEGFGSDGRDAEENLNFALTGRGVWSRHRREGRVLHLGGWASQRDFGSDLLGTGLSRGELRRATTRLADAGIGGQALAAKSLTQLGIEGALVRGPFSLQGEWAGRRIQAVDDALDGTQSGFYLTTSYFLTGHSRAYDPRRGVFLIPQRPTNAWELVARYSNLNASATGEGTRVGVVTLGINYYVNRVCRLMVNVLDARVKGPGAAELLGDLTGGEALTARFELVF